MIGTEYIHQPVEFPPEFFAVIGNIGQPVGGLAAALDNHPVFIHAELGCLEPDRSILFIDQPLVAQCNDYIVDQARLEIK